MAEETTTLDDDVTKPSQTAPGDGPADTTDPSEQATSVTPTPGDEAIAAGTVNAVRKTPKKAAPRRRKDEDRVEEYTLRRPDGKLAHVKRNIDTGESEVVKVTEDE